MSIAAKIVRIIKTNICVLASLTMGAMPFAQDLRNLPPFAQDLRDGKSATICAGSQRSSKCATICAVCQRWGICHDLRRISEMVNLPPSAPDFRNPVILPRFAPDLRDGESATKCWSPLRVSTWSLIFAVVGSHVF